MVTSPQPTKGVQTLEITTCPKPYYIVEQADSGESTNEMANAFCGRSKMTKNGKATNEHILMNLPFLDLMRH